MIVVRNLGELKQQLELRKKIVQNQASVGSSARKAEMDDMHRKGMIAAFNEAIDMVQVLFDATEATTD